MPDGQRSSSKGDKGLSGSTDENFMYDDCDENEGATEELTAIVKQVSRFTFNNFIHSERFQAQLMMDGNDVDMKNSLKLGADLVVLSVVLNKKQKENDEVALAIDRLRQNGVNCVFFTMNDMRNGATKSTTAESDMPESARRRVHEKRPGLPPSLPAQTLPSSLSSEDKISVDPSHIPKTLDSKSARKEIPEIRLEDTVAKGSVIEECQAQNSAPAAPNVEEEMQCEKLGKWDIGSVVSLVTMSKPPAIPLTEDKESPAQHDHLMPPLLSPAEPEPDSVDQKSKQKPLRKRRRRRKYPYSFTNTKVKPKKKGTVSKVTSDCNGTIPHDAPPIIDKCSDLPQTQNLTQIAAEHNEDFPPVLTRADFAENSSPVPIKRRVRKTKADRIAEAVRASVAICGAPPEVVLRQPRKCTTKIVPITAKKPKVVVEKEVVPEQMEEPLKDSLEATQSLKVSIPLNQVKIHNRKIRRCNNTPPQLTNSQSALETPKASSIPASSKLNSQMTKPANAKETITRVMSRKRTRSQSLEDIPLIQLQPETRRASSPDIIARLARSSANGNRIKYLKQRSPSPDITSSSSGRSQSLNRSVQQTKISVHGPSERMTQRSASLSSAFASAPPNIDLSPLECLEKETKNTLEKLLTAVVSSVDNEADPALQHVQLRTLNSEPLPPVPVESEDLVPDEGKVPTGDEPIDQKPYVAVLSASLHSSEDSLPDFPFPDSMQLRRSSFFSLITGNVRTNMEKYLDGRSPTASLKALKRRRRPKNGFLLHHGDNCPEDPESPYKLHLATQVLLKLSKRRSKVGPKEDRGKTLLSYLKLVPKRPVRAGKPIPKAEEKQTEEGVAKDSVFSGEWTIDRKYVCNVCGATENCFWDMVTHKGEEHPGVVVTHVELPANQHPPSSLIRKPPPEPKPALAYTAPPPCAKCSATFSSMSDLHGHIFSCAGNSSWLEEKVVKKPRGRRKRGFKRRFSSTPKKNKQKSEAQQTGRRRSSDPFKCEFCSREFKTEGWLRNHMTTHSLPVSIPLDKLPLASLPVRACLRKLKY